MFLPLADFNNENEASFEPSRLEQRFLFQRTSLDRVNTELVSGRLYKPELD